MSTHSSILTWKIPQTVEPGELHTTHGVAKKSDIIEHACTELLALFKIQAHVLYFISIFSWEREPG